MANLPSFFRRESPFRELSRMQRQIDRIFDELSVPWGEEILPLSGRAAFTPACDVQETDNHYLMSFDLPGVKKDDLKIELIGNELCVSGERRESREEKSAAHRQWERSYGAFSRSFTLPQGVKADQIETDYRDGVLHVAVPKTEGAKAQRISIGERPGLMQKLLGHRKEEKKGERVA